jgi:putative copper resistance protein D
LAWLVLVAAGMSGLPLADAWRPAVLSVVLEQTRFGHVWLIRLGLLLLLLCHLAWARRGRAPSESRPTTIGIALAACVLVSQVWAGHATAAPLSHIAADAVHLLAATLWAGCLLPLLAVLARARVGAGGWSMLAVSAVRRFTGVGVFGVAALMVTGVINGRMMVGSLQALSTTLYGQLVAAKIILFAAMVALAAINRFWLAPRLDSGPPQASAAARGLWRNVAAELALVAGIFAMVGVLGGSQPPAHEPGVGMPMQHDMDSAGH